MLRLLLIGIGVLLGSWVLLVVLAARLPEGTLKELAGFLPDCVTTARRLRKDPRVPLRAKLAIGFAGLWVLSPIDLIPEFLPVIGPLDDGAPARYQTDRVAAAVRDPPRGPVLFAEGRPARPSRPGAHRAYRGAAQEMRSLRRDA
jgi:hypothetical protein